MLMFVVAARVRNDCINIEFCAVCLSSAFLISVLKTPEMH